METLLSHQRLEWLDALSRCHSHDAYHLPGYHALAESRGDGRAHFFVYSKDNHVIGMPLLLRPVDPEQPNGWQDAASVYGYPGPIASQEAVPDAIVRDFEAEFTDSLRERRVVTVFSRMHPFFPQRRLCSGIGEIQPLGQTVSIDLTLPLGEQRARYSKTCRATLRKLGELGFIGVHDVEMKFFPEFVQIYQETMSRVGAATGLSFDRPYFDRLRGELGQIMHLFVALKDGSVAAATLCSLCNGIVQDHLGGTRDAFLKFSPDRLVVDTARIWATGEGAHTYHLGGGVGSRFDSLFEYKSRFSDRRHTFSTFQWILRPDIYQELCAKAGVSDANDRVLAEPFHFPAYRCPVRSRRTT